jgi:sec-independent protein translocase protein TatC
VGRPVVPAVSLVAVLALATVALTVASLAYWVRADASARELERPGRLSTWVVLFAPFLLYYVAVTRRNGERTRPLGRAEHVAGTLALASVTALLVGAVVSPPDPFTQVRYWLGGTAALVPVAYVALSRQGAE